MEWSLWIINSLQDLLKQLAKKTTGEVYVLMGW